MDRKKERKKEKGEQERGEKEGGRERVNTNFWDLVWATKIKDKTKLLNFKPVKFESPLDT